MLLQALGHGEVSLTDKCEKVVAKKGLFGWKVREEIKYADVSEMQK